MKRALIVLLVWAIGNSVVFAQDHATGKRPSSASARSKIYKLEEPQLDTD
jgi:hypothetical protein